MGIYGKKCGNFRKVLRESFTGKFYGKVLRESFTESFTGKFYGKVLQKVLRESFTGKFYGGMGSKVWIETWKDCWSATGPVRVTILTSFSRFN